MSAGVTGSRVIFKHYRILMIKDQRRERSRLYMAA